MKRFNIKFTPHVKLRKVIRYICREHHTSTRRAPSSTYRTYIFNDAYVTLTVEDRKIKVTLNDLNRTLVFDAYGDHVKDVFRRGYWIVHVLDIYRRLKRAEKTKERSNYLDVEDSDFFKGGEYA